MEIKDNYVYEPVKRYQAQYYLLLTLLSFAISVTLTRLFLELTGYPQIGNSELHIAHVLWGGLLLFVANLILIIFSNRWSYPLGAILAGVGVGLFIDEVGKFITQKNDYFYPLAAPIIYAFFLLTVMLYVRVRRYKRRDPRVEMYHAMDLMSEVLDHDLEPSEKEELVDHLEYVSNRARNPDLKHLSELLLGFVDSGNVHIAPETPSVWQKFQTALLKFERRWLKKRRYKVFLIVGQLAIGILAITNLISLSRLLTSPREFQDMVQGMVVAGHMKSLQSVFWFTGKMALEGIIGVLLILSAMLLAIGKDRHGTYLGYIGLLIALTASNLLVFYFDQFSAISLVIPQLIFLLGIIHYQKIYIEPHLPRIPKRRTENQDNTSKAKA